MIARVFPKRRYPLKTTPNDALAFIGEPPLIPPEEITQVKISGLFTWDIPEVERLARVWSRIAPVEVGGPAFDSFPKGFEPGMFVRHGYTITSRGCPNNCWFCQVPKREGPIRELPIRDGWNVLDSNLLACSDAHIRAVFSMLSKQNRKPEFTGGLEAARMKPWIAESLRKLKPKQVFFAYDSKDDLEPLLEAGRMMLSSGFTIASHVLRCYVLIGFPKDSFDAAEKRLKQTIEAGFTPMAMLYRNNTEKVSEEWKRFQRLWARPAIICGRV